MAQVNTFAIALIRELQKPVPSFLSHLRPYALFIQIQSSVFQIKIKMQHIGRAARSWQEIVKDAILQNPHRSVTSKMDKIFSQFGRVTCSSSSMQQKGLENVTVAEVLMAKGDQHTGSWLWCRSNDPVLDAAKNVSLQYDLDSKLHYITINSRLITILLQMAQNDIGSLVVLKPGENQYVAGIITERGV